MSIEKRSGTDVSPAPVIHLSAREGRSLIFLSQVAKPVSFLAQNGVDISIAMICQFGDFVRTAERAQWGSQARSLDALGVSWHRLASFPTRLQAWAPDQSSLTRFLRSRFSSRDRFLLHCRGTYATQLALKLRGRFPEMRIVSDCRGVDGPESAEHRGLIGTLSAADVRWLQSLEHAQQTALKSSDAVLCVSHAMKDHLVRVWDVDASSIGVVPTCYSGRMASRADPDVQRIRSQYGFEGKTVMAHSASETPWQRIEDVVRLCVMLAERAPSLHFLFLTQQAQRMESRLARHGLATHQATVISARHDEVAPHLAAADVGVMLRNHSPVSAVASPVKFAEYLAAGLPVIVTPGVGDQADLVAKRGVGLVLPTIEVDQSAADAIIEFLAHPTLMADARNRAPAVVEQHLSWPSYLDVFRQTYARAAASTGPEPAQVAGARFRAV